MTEHPDTRDHENELSDAVTPAPKKGNRFVFVLKMLLPVLILAGGIMGATYLKNTGTRPQKKPPRKITPLVTVMPLTRTDERIEVRAMGTVVPAREIVIKPRVSGQVVKIHPELVQGGFVREGDELFRIDPADYELDLAQKKSRVADAEYALKLEMGHQQVAQREWELLGKGTKKTNADLALRRPHLDKAKADLAAAKAALKQAELNLARTRITAPFNAVVRSKTVEIGSQVAAQEPVAELVGTNEYWVQVSVPIDRLAWLRIPRNGGGEGSPVRVRYAGGQSERKGEVIKLLSDLETEGRMARLLVAVADPLDLSKEMSEKGRPPLLIGEYVSVAIEGRLLEDVFRIPRTALRDNGAIWLVDDAGKLAIREVVPLWRDGRTVMVRDGFRDGDRLIISDLAAPVAGMPLRIEGEPEPQSADAEPAAAPDATKG